jgi:hypothetical protein
MFKGMVENLIRYGQGAGAKSLLNNAFILASVTKQSHQNGT